ncbi:MAG: NAD-dependent epimerase/dehydratase family protein [Myxococcota bacterium]|nr:NAD-dependent epimerase/dehydratase family protein [Myxococcota bacterium]
MSETVLVTGADGLLGSACIDLLLKQGSEVIAVVRDADRRSRFFRDGLIEHCTEVRETLASASRLLAEYRPDVVLHLAAQTQVPVANTDPLSTFESNVRGTWLLLEACRTNAKSPSAVVVASSDKAYGTGTLPYTEDSPLKAEAPYDVSKAATDLVARSYGLHFGLPVVVTRCGNIYGPGDLNEARLVPGVCLSLSRGEPPTLRSTGTMSREWLYVEDAARATLLLAEQAAAHHGQAFNIGGGETATANDIAARLISESGRSLVPRTSDTDPPGEITHQSLDSSRIHELGWTPQVSLDEGLAHTWAWYRRVFSNPSLRVQGRA